ncbi:MAG: GNAT family N-acetyltransferase [Armatimonadota bacterium]|nr:GNAT family N-acetyltransferase [Armatimonadota bacterium]
MSELRDQVFRQFPLLETERLRLRHSRPADAEAMLTVLSSEVVCRYYDLSPLASLSEAADLIACRAAAFAHHERIRWVLAQKEDDGVIGSCGLSRWDEANGQAEIGYELSPDWQGRGLMREALAAVLAFGFSEMQLEKIEANVVPENEPSLRLLRRLGFQEVELRRERGFWKGRSHDLIHLLRHRKDGDE